MRRLGSDEFSLLSSENHPVAFSARAVLANAIVAAVLFGTAVRCHALRCLLNSVELAHSHSRDVRVGLGHKLDVSIGPQGVLLVVPLGRYLEHTAILER